MSSMLKRKAKQLVQTVQGGTDRWVSWLKGTAFKAIAVLLLGTLQLWLSLFLYGSFYYSYMPTVAHVSPVYLQFSSCEQFGAQTNCPFPSVNSTLVKNPEMGNMLMRGQKYKVLLELDMPQSPVNERQGVFMVRLDMYAAGGEIIGTSSRPAMMHYQSNLLKTIQTLFFIPLLLSGYSEEKQAISVTLMENFVDNPYKPLVGAHVQLQARQLEIYSSVLKIQAYFSGLRYLMYQWPISTALVFISIFFLFLSLISVVSWQQCVRAFGGQPEGTVVAMEDVYSVAYEERRKMIRKTMASERAALFKSYPQNVTIVGQGSQDEGESQSSGISSVGDTYTGDRESSIIGTIKVSNIEASSDGSWAKTEPTEETPKTANEDEVPVIADEAGSSVKEEVAEEEKSSSDSEGVVVEGDEVVEKFEEETEKETEEIDEADVEGEVEVIKAAESGPVVPDGEELRQRKK